MRSTYHRGKPTTPRAHNKHKWAHLEQLNTLRLKRRDIMPMSSKRTSASKTRTHKNTQSTTAEKGTKRTTAKNTENRIKYIRTEYANGYSLSAHSTSSNNHRKGGKSTTSHGWTKSNSGRMRRTNLSINLEHLDLHPSLNHISPAAHLGHALPHWLTPRDTKPSLSTLKTTSTKTGAERGTSTRTDSGNSSIQRTDKKHTLALTLTVKDTGIPPTPHDYYQAIQQTMRTLQEQHGLLYYTWVIEPTKQLTPHVHAMLTLARPTSTETIAQHWLQHIEEAGGQAQLQGQHSRPIRSIADARRWIGYISKMAGKSEHEYQRRQIPHHWSHAPHMWKSTYPVQATRSTHIDKMEFLQGVTQTDQHRHTHTGKPQAPSPEAVGRVHWEQSTQTRLMAEVAQALTHSSALTPASITHQAEAPHPILDFPTSMSTDWMLTNENKNNREHDGNVNVNAHNGNHDEYIVTRDDYGVSNDGDIVSKEGGVGVREMLMEKCTEPINQEAWNPLSQHHEHTSTILYGDALVDMATGEVIGYSSEQRGLVLQIA